MTLFVVCYFKFIYLFIYYEYCTKYTKISSQQVKKIVKLNSTLKLNKSLQNRVTKQI